MIPRAHVIVRAVRNTLVPAFVLLVPGAGAAAWGSENWGEMLWGGSAFPIPAMSSKDLIALGALLLLVSAALVARRRSAAQRSSRRA